MPVPQSFDDLLLMKYGGSVIYHGHLGKRSHRLIEYFKAVPGVPDLQEGLNPATWMLQVSTPGMESTLGVNFAEIYQNSDLFRSLLRQCSGLHRAPLRVPASASAVDGSAGGNGCGGNHLNIGVPA